MTPACGPPPRIPPGFGGCAGGHWGGVAAAARPRSGRHTHRFGDGTYSGDWRDGKMHGQGTYTWADGSRFHGDRWVREAGGRARAREEMKERGVLAGVEGGSGA